MPMLFSLSFKDGFKTEMFPPAASMWEQVGAREEVEGKRRRLAENTCLLGCFRFWLLLYSKLIKTSLEC